MLTESTSTYRGWRITTRWARVRKATGKQGNLYGASFLIEVVDAEIDQASWNELPSDIFDTPSAAVRYALASARARIDRVLTGAGEPSQDRQPKRTTSAV